MYSSTEALVVQKVEVCLEVRVDTEHEAGLWVEEADHKLQKARLKVGRQSLIGAAVLVIIIEVSAHIEAENIEAEADSITNEH